MSIKPRTISWDEYQQHDKPGDMWILIHNKVYDISEWVHKHPGGDLILLGVKRDATILFESSHLSPHVREQILPKLFIGDIEDKVQKQAFYTWDSPFYDTLKARVLNYFKERKLSHHDHPLFYAKIMVIIAIWLLMGYLSFIRGYSLAALCCGYLFMQFGISVMHDGNHGATSKNVLITRITGMFLDFMGGSSRVWQHTHNIGHHSHTNLADDPDANTGYPIFRFSPAKEHQPHHVYQSLYIWFVYCGVVFRWIISDVVEMITGDVGKPVVKLYRGLTPISYIAIFVLMKFVFVAVLLVPIYLHGLGHGLLLILLVGIAASQTAALNFAVTHISNEVFFPDKSPKETDWAKLQVMTSSNYSVKSFFTCMLSGGLNCQIEHHLFPTINHPYYIDIAPIVQATCKEFGVPYTVHSSFLQAVYSHYQYVKRLGNPDPVQKEQKEHQKVC